MRARRNRALMASAAVACAMLGFSVPAQAAVHQFAVTTLAGANEAPPIVSSATGDAQFSSDGVGSVCFTIHVSGLAGPPTGAHIHVGAAGVAGPVVVPLPLTGVGPSYTGCASVTTVLLSQILSSPSGYYLNVHDALFPAGELRGQLVGAATADSGPASLTFGSAAAPTPQGTLSAPQVLTLTNNGIVPLAVAGFAFGGSDPGDFTVGADTCHAPVAPGASCSVQVRFVPQTQGLRSATLSVLSNAPAAFTPISLQGTAGPLPAGPPGPPGPRGNAGQIRLMTCSTVTVKVHKHKVKRRRCTTKLINGSATFTIAGAGDARASLARHGLLYATGTAGPTGLVLHARRMVRPGLYTLELRYRRAQRDITASTLIEID